MVSQDDVGNFSVNRRQLLRGLGAVGLAGLAGCSNQTDEGGDNRMSPKSPTSSTAPQKSKVKMGGELVATFSADVKNFDPTQINDTTSGKAFTLVYESLMATDFAGKPQPYLAESVEVTGPNKKQARIKLKKGITFHDGSSLTAEDVKSSFERYKGSPREADVYDWYKSSTVVDKRTLDVMLSRRYAPLKFTLGGVPIVPGAATTDELDLSKNPIGTGPYKFARHEPDNLFRLTRNEKYWFTGSDVMPKKPPIKTLTFRVITEQSAQLAALKAGDVAFINSPPAGSVKDLRNNNKFTVTERTAGGFDMFIYPMHKKADTPFQNRKVRLGVNRLIPREAIVKTVYDGIGVPAYAPISPLAKQFTSEKFQQKMKKKYSGYDPKKATKLLEQGFSEAGFDKPFKTNIITNQNPQRVEWSKLLRESLNETEFFQVGLNQYEWNTYTSKILAKDSHTLKSLISLGWSAGWDPDAYVHNLFYKKQFTPACCNVNHFSNEKITNLIEKGLETYDIKKRRKIYERLQRAIVEDSPMAFIRFGKSIDAFTANTVKGFSTYPIDGTEYAGIYAPYAEQFTYMNK